MKTNKSPNRRALKVLGLAVMVVLVAGLALAQGPGQGKGRGMGMKADREGSFSRGEGHGLEMMAKRLDLSDTQMEEIKTLAEAGRSQGLSARRELMQLRNELEGEMLKNAPSEKTVLSLNEKIGNLKTEMKANRLKTRLAIREVLTPEQRDKMLVMGPRGREGRHGHRGPGDREGRFGCGPGARGGQDCPLDKDDD